MGLVRENLVGSFGENVVEGGNSLHDGFPKAGIVRDREKFWFREHRKPRLLFYFVLKLVFFPAGISYESANNRARFVDVADGVFRGDTGFKMEILFLIPKCREGKVGFGDRATDVDLHREEVGKLVSLEEISDGVSGRLIENEAHRTVFLGMISEKND